MRSDEQPFKRTSRPSNEKDEGHHPEQSESRSIRISETDPGALPASTQSRPSNNHHQIIMQRSIHYNKSRAILQLLKLAIIHNKVSAKFFYVLDFL